MREIQQLRQHWSDIGWWRQDALPYLSKKLHRRTMDFYADLYYQIKRVDFVSIPDSDWDNLLVLDACRYDYFKEICSIDGDLNKRYSRAPQTPVFFEENFRNREMHDTVYVSGNPYIKRKVDDHQFHKVYHVWKTHWDDGLKTVHPRAINQVAEEAATTYPNKRLIIHYMQPHTPYIGPWARNNIGITAGNQHSREVALTGEYNGTNRDPHVMLQEGQIKRESVLRAYKENLTLVLNHVSNLLKDLSGKNVITADHGELFGERAWPGFGREYQHPNIMAEKLLQIPWFIPEPNDDSRKTVITEPPSESRHSEQDLIEEKLEHLGYR